MRKGRHGDHNTLFLKKNHQEDQRAKFLIEVAREIMCPLHGLAWPIMEQLQRQVLKTYSETVHHHLL